MKPTINNIHFNYQAKGQFTMGNHINKAYQPKPFIQINGYGKFNSEMSNTLADHEMSIVEGGFHV